VQISLTAQYDRVIRFGTPDRPTFWPAWSQPGGTLVDLRLFPPPGMNRAATEKIYRPDELRKAGVPEALIMEAAASEPMGFVLIPRSAPDA
jgi:hypothetical protein